MIAKTKRNVNLTEGPILGKMILFVLPLMATNLLQVLYNAADMMVVSLSGEKGAVGAIGFTGSFITMIINIFIGFSMGANVIVARHLGAKNEKGASAAVHTALTLGASLGLIAAIIGVFVCRPVLSLMGAEGKLLDLATKYTVLYFLGAPFISVTNYAVSILRAKGDTRTPLIVLSLSGVANVILNLIFVLVVGLSVEGVAIATAAANLISAVALVIKLTREEGACHFDIKRMGFDRDALLPIVKIGFPAAIQGALFSISNIMIQSSILRVNNMLAPAGSAYEPVVQGNAAVTNLNNFVYNATNSVCAASITFTSQNVGAGKYNRLYRVMLCAFVITTVIALIFSGVIAIFNRPLLSLYGITDGAQGSLEHIAYETAMVKISIETLFYFLLAWMEVGSGVVRGLGKSLTSTVISLIGSCLLRIVWLLTAFEANPTATTIYLSYPLSWLVTALALFAVAFVIIAREKRRLAITEV